LLPAAITVACKEKQAKLEQIGELWRRRAMQSTAPEWQSTPGLVDYEQALARM